MEEQRSKVVPAVVMKTRKTRQNFIAVKIVAFVSALLIFALMGIMVPLRPQVSDIEKRQLAKFPEFTVKAFLNGTYFSEIDTWYSDTYPMRDRLIAANNQVRKLYGSKEQELVINQKEQVADSTADSDNKGDKNTGTDVQSNDALSGDGNGKDHDTEASVDGSVDAAAETIGDVYIAEGRAFELFYFSETHSTRYAKLINGAKKAWGNSVEVYCLPAPINAGIVLSEKMQKKLGSSNQQDAITYIGSKLDKSVKLVDSYQELRNHNSESVYFNTDHHWTQRGAYYAYTVFAKAKGLTAHKLKDYKTKTYEGFLGTFYAETQSSSLKQNADKVETFLPIAVNEYTATLSDGTTQKLPVVGGGEDKSAGSKYMCFIGGDQPLGYIQNPQLKDGSSILVIKESYANCFIPFLVDHYQNVYLIDYRYYKQSVINFVKEKGIKEVLFLNNLSAVNERLRLDEMEKILNENQLK